MLVDSHAHLDLFPDDLDAVVEQAQAAGVGTILAIGIGDGPDTMHRALDLAREAATHDRTDHPQIFATAGIHPESAAQTGPAELARLEALLADPLVLACGEIGLDYYHLDNPDPAIQQAAFVAQMALAAAARKPIILHCRTSELATPAARARFGPADAWEDLLALLTEHWAPAGLPGIMHCFSGTPSHARRSLDLGFTLSFAGNLTYPAASAIREAATLAPPHRLLVETDSPFLAPVPHRGQRNQPAFVRETARVLAALRGITLEQLSEQTSRNFETLFPTAASRPHELSTPHTLVHKGD